MPSTVLNIGSFSSSFTQEGDSPRRAFRPSSRFGVAPTAMRPLERAAVPESWNAPPGPTKRGAHHASRARDARTHRPALGNLDLDTVGAHAVVIAADSVGGNPDSLAWLADSTRGAGSLSPAGKRK